MRAGRSDGRFAICALTANVRDLDGRNAAFRRPRVEGRRVEPEQLSGFVHVDEAVGFHSVSLSTSASGGLMGLPLKGERPLRPNPAQSHEIAMRPG